MTAGFWRPVEGCVLVEVRLTPKSAADRIEGVVAASDGSLRLKARVRAVPEDGKANKAVEQLLAKALGVPKSAVSIVAGHAARSKTLRVDGDPASIGAALERLAE
ncbi:DUF167 domain-containing protein [Aurantimonas aggregata]|uniref:UPF0235 protein GTW51_12185 n=1 Tax=Aurantimonas aggregata TaxID=2047720 RepID=A0A6L9MIF6_9HYPH|nr:DUF167 family protein [Aurantimonas aggregata]NDV87458.1 DUF167 domain-containing protein [Aurantimonas aggregata]